MKGHKLVTDAHDHFVLQHADGSHFKVAKNGLSAPMVGHIAKMPKVEHHFEGTQPNAYSGLLDGAKAANPDADMSLPDAPLAQSLRGEGTGSGADWKPDAPRAASSLDITSNSRPGDDAAAAAGDLGKGPVTTPSLGSQTYPTPTGEAPAETTPQSAQQPAAPDISGQYLQDATAAMNSAKGANNDKAEAEGQIAEDTATAVQNNLDQQAAKDAVYTTEHQKLDAHGEDLYKQVSEGKIDPGHMWSSASTGSKVGMIAGILLSGIGSGLAGQPNMAMGVINKAIDADIDAQKANMSKNMGLLHYNLQKTRDLETAHAQTRLDLLSTMKGQIALAAAKQGTAVAQANAQGLNAQIDLQMAGLKQQVAQSKAMLSLATGTAQGGADTPDDINPQKLRGALLLGSHGYPNGIPKEQAAQAMTEYGAFKHQQSVSSTLSSNFATMTQNHGTGIGNGVLASEAKKKWEAAANIVGMTVDHELAGRVTETTLQEVKDNNLPRWGDSPETLATKLNAISDAVKAANTKEAHGYGTLITYGMLSPNNPHISSSSQTKSQGRSR